MPLPVLPRFFVSTLPASPLLFSLSLPPPHAARARRLAVARATADLFRRIAYFPFELVVPQPHRRRWSTTTPGVERVAHRVTEEVQGEGQQRDRSDREPQVEPVVRVIGRRVRHHLAQRGRAGQAEPEEGEAG